MLLLTVDFWVATSDKNNSITIKFRKILQIHNNSIMQTTFHTSNVLQFLIMKVLRYHFFIFKNFQLLAIFTFDFYLHVSYMLLS